MTLEALCTPSSDVLVYDTFNASAAAACAASAGSFLFGNAPALQAPAEVPAASQAVEVNGDSRAQPGRRKRRRRQRSVRNAEDAETQRMTHIAVERNRRRQMNEYLTVLRSLMPDSYVHRSDQASIVSGAIDFVKELEQQLQSLEAQTLALQQQQQRRTKAGERDVVQAPSGDPAASGSATEEDGAAREGPPQPPPPPPFAQFFRYPQYAWRHAAPRRPEECGAVVDEAAGRASTAAADVEVGVVVDAHASLRVMARRRPGQLLEMVAGLQALGLAVLHLNVVATAPDALALYTLSLKVEEGCGLATAEDIAAAVHHVLCIIDAEATPPPLDASRGRPDL
ncbi:hypothetical protein U9M48_033613 [Paspalum notatum var. saurae]|uniref:BHLH domain-containing protein n=1 Tax=Paspalum notatum var. saurae TaxID=547442 RepID=A0AAQ3U7S0_PASNO